MAEVKWARKAVINTWLLPWNDLKVPANPYFYSLLYFGYMSTLVQERIDYIVSQWYSIRLGSPNNIFSKASALVYILFYIIALGYCLDIIIQLWDQNFKEPISSAYITLLPFLLVSGYYKFIEKFCLHPHVQHLSKYASKPIDQAITSELQYASKLDNIMLIIGFFGLFLGLCLGALKRPFLIPIDKAYWVLVFWSLFLLAFFIQVGSFIYVGKKCSDFEKKISDQNTSAKAKQIATQYH